MKIKFVVNLILLFFMLPDNSSAQTHGNNVFVELGGPGVASINYDMRFQNKENGLGFRVGIGGFSIDGSSSLFVPLGLNYLISKDDKNYFELGAGVTFVSTNASPSDGVDFNSNFGHLYFGYRRQPKKGGFLFRAGIVPIFGKGFFLPFYAGVSCGYKF